MLDSIYSWILSLPAPLPDVAKILIVAVPLMIGMAMTTYYERKVIGAMQLRRGPNTVGFLGLLQPFADGLKLLCKETIFSLQRQQGFFSSSRLCSPSRWHCSAGR